MRDPWDAAPARVLVVGPEPNGDNNRPERPDMGAWFREANRANTFHGNGRFFRRTIAQVAGALGDSTAARDWALDGASQVDADRWCAVLRYVDLKDRAGGAKANERDVLTAALARIDAIVRFWCPETGDPAAPTITVVQGNTAQHVFARAVLPVLRERRAKGLYVGALHPSGRASNADAAECAAMLRREARPFRESGRRWHATHRWIEWDEK